MLPARVSIAHRAAAMSSSALQSSLQRSPLACIVYVSEGRDAAALQHLEGVAREAAEAVALASLFVDEPYHRSNFCLVGRSVEQLAAAAARLSKAALRLLDLRHHSATHPRLGVVDHISCHPLAAPGPLLEAGAGMQQAANLARAIGQELGGGEGAVPVFLYGAAHPQQRALADVRRAMGYFQGSSQGQWADAVCAPPSAADTTTQAQDAAAALLPLAPDFGPRLAPLRSGVCCVGACPLILNFNVLLRGVGFEAARGIARGVSERGGGLRSVQAMALHHDQGVEVACNILDPTTTPPEAVEARVAALAAAAGGEVAGSYRIGKSSEELRALAEGL